MSTKKRFDLSKPEDIEELQRLIFEDDDLGADIQEENLEESDESDSDDLVETRSSDSDTDHEYLYEADEEFEEPEIDDECFYGKDGTPWKKEPPKLSKMRPHNILVKLPGVVGQDAKNAKTEFQCWNLFFTDSILNLLVKYTNAYIENVREKFGRERDCRPTNIAEVKAFLGLLYLAGVFRGGHQRLTDFWATDGLGIDIFRMTMSERRFRFIIRCLRFDNKETRETRRKIDKLAAVRELFTVFIENCQKHYHLGQNATIDEMLPAFRGRCSFRQYIPSKPNKYGIKIFSLSDAKLYYTANMEIYCGQQPEGPYNLPNSADSIVLRLSTPIFGSGRNITADNWFTSLKLVRELAKKKLSYVGTVRKNKRELPEIFICPKNRSCFSSIFGYTKDETLVSYVPKKGKTVVLLSSLHTSSKKFPMNQKESQKLFCFTMTPNQELT